MQCTQLVPLLQVKSVAKGLEFYKDAFEAEVTAQWPETGDVLWAHIKIGDVDFMLGTPQDKRLSDRSGLGLFEDGVVYYLTVDDADAVHARLKGQGFEVTDPEDQFYGFREFYIQDPDGNQFALGHGIPAAEPPA